MSSVSPCLSLSLCLSFSLSELLFLPLLWPYFLANFVWVFSETAFEIRLNKRPRGTRRGKNGKKTELKCNKVAGGVTGGKWGSGRVSPGQAVAHFSFVVGSCSFRFFIERKRESERKHGQSKADTLGKFTLELAGFSAAGGRGGVNGRGQGRETETHVTDLFHFRKHLSTQRICLKISNWAPSMPAHCSVRSSSVWVLFLKLTNRYSARGVRRYICTTAMAGGSSSSGCCWGWPPKNKLMMCPFDT